MWSIYTMKCYSTIRKNEIMPFASTWMDLKSVILSELSQREKEKYCMTSLLCGLWKEMILMNLLTKEKETHRLRKWTYSCWGEEIIRELRKVVYTLIYLKWITNKHSLYSDHMELCSMSCGRLDGRGGLGGEWIHVHVWLSPSVVHLKLPQHC